MSSKVRIEDETVPRDFTGVLWRTHALKRLADGEFEFVDNGTELFWSFRAAERHVLEEADSIDLPSFMERHDGSTPSFDVEPYLFVNGRVLNSGYCAVTIDIDKQGYRHVWNNAEIADTFDDFERANETIEFLFPRPVYEPGEFVDKSIGPESTTGTIDAFGRLWKPVIIKNPDPHAEKPFDVWMTSAKLESGEDAPFKSISFDAQGFDEYSTETKARDGLARLCFAAMCRDRWIEDRLNADPGVLLPREIKDRARAAVDAAAPIAQPINGASPAIK